MGAFRKLISVSILACLLTLHANPALGIMYGTEDTNAGVHHPWVVSIWKADSIETYSTPYFLCSGSLIEADVVLTAAHCIDPTGFYFVKVGSATLTDDTLYSAVDAVWKHPRFSRSKFVNDVGLLKLEHPVMGATMPLIASPSLAKSINNAKGYKVYGWGVDQNNEDATYLRWAKLENLDSIASQKMKKYGFSTSTQLAAGHYIAKERVFEGTCHGDSGGPLILDAPNGPIIVGVTSWGLGNSKTCDTSNPSIFARVSYYEREIKKAIPTLMVNAEIANRSIPSSVTEPTITGNAAVGSKLSCNAGLWSANTSSTSMSWIGAYGQVLGNLNPLTVTSDMEGQVIGCRIVATNQNASVQKTVKIQIQLRPKAAGYLSISGVGYSTPASGASISCGGLTWGAGVTETFDWYISQLPLFDYSTDKNVAHGSSFSLTPSARKDMAGNWLTCVSTGKSSAGAASIYTNVYIPTPQPPTAWASTSYEGLNAATGSKSYKCTNISFSSSTISTTAVNYKWGIADIGTYHELGLEIGSGQVLTLDAATRKSYDGKTLTCKVTVSNEDGSADSYSSLYLSAYSN